ncbi:hypothetical protein INR49_022754 [Caranx melampygus]|nr:hypothetical protein INR49_022754 [Caranx melampygus]
MTLKKIECPQWTGTAAQSLDSCRQVSAVQAGHLSSSAGTVTAGVLHRWLGVTAEGVPEKLGCANLPLNNRQRELCRKKPLLLPSIQDGARLAISECQSQFKHERWNCSTTTEPSVFGAELTSGESDSC